MKITLKDWNNYVAKLSAICQKSSELMQAYIQEHGISDTQALINYAHALCVKYGEGSAELACLMYDAISEAENVKVPSAEPAKPASIVEVGKAVSATKQNSDLLSGAISRMVKRTAADTTLKNAIRDKAQFAWITHGDTCAFCIAISSRGFQNVGKNTLKNGHAEHIHAHCDCQYAVRHKSTTNYEGYDPDSMYDQYMNASDGSYKDKINAMRRLQYKEHSESINAQKREAYAKRKEAKDGS